MKSELAAFLAAIIAEPADDTVRLVFADWLDENGESRWATFIRSHVAHRDERRASSLPMPLSKVIFAGECWSGLPASQIILSRGFACAVECTAGFWLAHGDAIRREHPVTLVRLTATPEHCGDGLQGDPIDKRFESAELNAAYQLGDSLAMNLLRCRWPGVTFQFPLAYQGER